MPYKSHSPDSVDRSRNYVLIWFGGASALFTFVNLFIGMDNLLVVMAYGGMAGGLLQSVLGLSGDEYFRSLCSVGHRWAIVALGVFLMVLFISANGEIAKSAGAWLASGEARATGAPIRVPFLENAIFLSVLVSLAFYAGYAFAWLRDRADQES
jgi:hypothetical protein